MTVLVLGDPQDEHATEVVERLRDRQVECHLLDSRWYPSQLSLWMDPKSGEGEFGFPSGARVALDEVTAVYWRNYEGVVGPRLPSEEQSWIAENDSRSLFESVLLTLPARWVNSFDAFRYHQTKGAQLAAVAKLKVRVPDTLLTNDPATVEDFLGYHPRSIFKPVQGGAHARRVTPEMLDPRQLRHLALAPITLQQEIPGTNIRVFVAGEQIQAIEIQTEAIDFRDDAEPKLAAHELPVEVRSQCFAIAETLRLVWTGIDFRRTAEGEYYFLEANPSPMFLGFEEATGLPLTEMLLSLLTASERS